MAVKIGMAVVLAGLVAGHLFLAWLLVQVQWLIWQEMGPWMVPFQLGIAALCLVLTRVHLDTVNLRTNDRIFARP